MFLQQTGTQVTMMVPPTSAVAPSKEGGREKLKNSTKEKSEENYIDLHHVPTDDIPKQNFHSSQGLLHVI